MRIIAAGSGKSLPLEISATLKDKTAVIAIKGSIYQWNQASSMDVEAAIKGFKKEGITRANVYINSNGGDCFEANEIANLIKDNFREVKVNVGAIAASAGTYFLTLFHSTAKRNSQFMIHKPKGSPSGNEDEIEGGLKLIKNITQDYRAAYAKKMGITEDEVEKLWAKGDYWMTAQEAKSKGLIDEIEDGDEAIDAFSRMQLVACGAPVIPKAENNQNQINMELSVLAVSLGLPATATQAEVDAKLTELKAKAAQADSLVQAQANREKAEKSAKIKALLDGAEQAKKIDAKQRPHFETMAEANFEAAEAVISGMPSIEAISGVLSPGSTGGSSNGREKWTYADYQQNDPKAFEALEESAQAALIEAHYKE